MWHSLRERGHRFNEKVGDTVANWLSEMWFFWFTICLALLSLPAILTQVDEHITRLGVDKLLPEWLIDTSLIALVTWFSSTLIQLSALPVLAFQNKRAERAAAKDANELRDEVRSTHGHTAEIIEALDLKIEGGLQSVYKLTQDIHERVVEQD